MPLPTSLAHRIQSRTRTCLPLLSEGAQHGLGHGLEMGRVHEACGPARHRLALWLVAQTTGPVIWIVPDWSTEHLNPCGMMPFIDPTRLIMVHAKQTDDMLWSMEEVLRAGIAPLAVADMPGLPGLTPVRRMHLAAENGGIGKGITPLGLLLTPGMGGAQGVESRWHVAPDHRGSQGRWRLTRLRARAAPEQTWEINHHSGHALPRISGSIKAA
ncbi:hypothetical protein [uncultured Tateyamaria sp.]|uniref:ImuA family protein n=1 Tax=uncultured Tateyamaria sp. TaxID=455651 RepID=UPI00262BFF81|nr:hypothetical protein [uncultured Tateyamaria sp.]